MRKIFLLAVISSVFLVNLFAQPNKPLNIKIDIHYFKNGKISTYEIWDRSIHGRAYALDKSGKEIYNHEIGFFGGSSRTEFTYYPDGAIKTARATMQPDGGIQYFDVTYYYNNDGIMERTEDNSIGNGGHLHVTIPNQLEKPTEPSTTSVTKPSQKHETTTCAVIYTNEFFFINSSRIAVNVTITRNGVNDKNTVAIAPGDTVMGGTYPLSQFFEGPQSYYKYEISPLSRKLKGKYSFTTLPEQKEKVDNSSMKYFISIKAIRKQSAQKK